MAALPGQIMNPNGYNGRDSYGHKAKNRIQKGLDNAITLLGKQAIDNNGATRLGELIAAKLESDVIGTLKALSTLLPKQVQVDVNHSLNASQMSDDQLVQIIESRQKALEHAPGNTLEHENVAQLVKKDSETGHY